MYHFLGVLPYLSVVTTERYGGIMRFITFSLPSSQASKSALSNIGHTIRNDDAGKFCTIIKCTIFNRCCSFRDDGNAILNFIIY